MACNIVKQTLQHFQHQSNALFSCNQAFHRKLWSIIINTHLRHVSWIKTKGLQGIHSDQYPSLPTKGRIHQTLVAENRQYPKTPVAYRCYNSHSQWTHEIPAELCTPLDLWLMQCRSHSEYVTCFQSQCRTESAVRYLRRNESNSTKTSVSGERTTVRWANNYTAIVRFSSAVQNNSGVSFFLRGIQIWHIWHINCDIIVAT